MKLSNSFLWSTIQILRWGSTWLIKEIQQRLSQPCKKCWVNGLNRNLVEAFPTKCEPTIHKCSPEPKVVTSSKDLQAGIAINVVVANIDHHQANTHQVLELVVDVEGSMLQGTVLHMDRKYCKSKNPRNPKEHYSHRNTYEVSPERQGEKFEFEEDAIQIKFSRDSFHNDKHSSNIMLDEIEHTRALDDLLLCNWSGAKCMFRFKLDSGAGANIFLLNVYRKLFPDTKLYGTVDKQVHLIAANKTHITQLGTVRLRVCVRNKEKVCLFYVVPDMCHPISGLPDLTSMKLLSFDIPLESDWEANNSVDSIDSNLTKQTVLANCHAVFLV